MKSIVLFKALSQYDVLRYFVDDFSEAFRKLGYNTVVLDGLAHDFESQLVRVIESEDIYFFFTINGQVAYSTQDDNIFNRLRIPLFTFFVDHPLYHIDRLTSSVHNRVISFVAKEHLETCNRFVTDKPSVFIPHGADVDTREQTTPLINRDIPVMFAGTYENPDLLRKQWEENPNVKRILDIVVEESTQRDYVPYDVLLINTLEHMGLNPSVLGLDLVQFLFRAVDKYLRMDFRRKVISSIRSVPLHLFGNGWSALETDQNNLIIHPEISYLEVKEHMNNAKIVLDINPMYIHGAHERLFAGMASGAVVLAKANRYVQTPNTGLLNRKNIALYDTPEQADSFLNALLKSPVELESIGTSGKQIAWSCHTWTERAKQVLKAVEDSRISV